MRGACLTDLPDPVLGAIFGLTNHRSDGLSILLVSKHWLCVAESECPFLWEAPHLNGDHAALRSGSVKAVLCLAVQRKAPLFRALRISGSEEAFTATLPGLLRAVAGAGPQLQQLCLDVLFRWRKHYEESCEVCTLAAAEPFSRRSCG